MEVLEIMLHEWRVIYVGVLHLGASCSGVFSPIGRGNGYGIIINPPPGPLGVLRVNGEQSFCSMAREIKNGCLPQGPKICLTKKTP